MTERFDRDVHRDTGLPQERGVRMPEVVEADTRDCGAANEVAERYSEVPRDDRRTVRASEDESVVMVGGSQEHLYQVLLGSVLLQDRSAGPMVNARSRSVFVDLNASPALVCCSERRSQLYRRRG